MHGKKSETMKRMKAKVNNLLDFINSKYLLLTKIDTEDLPLVDDSSTPDEIPVVLSSWFCIV